MARTILVKDAAPGNNSNVGKLLTNAVWDNANGNRFFATGNDLIIAQNIHATLARTVTVLSVADVQGRSGDITAFSIPAGGLAVFGPFRGPGWTQTDGYVYLDGSTVDIKFSAVTL